MTSVKISALPTITRATERDYFIINDENQVSTKISWSNIKETLTRSNLTFTGSIVFQGPTLIGDQAGYSQIHLQKYPGILISSDQINNWDEAYGWGNHADEGYLDGSYEPERSDWAENDPTKYTFILNKPNIVVDSDGNIDNVNVDLSYLPQSDRGIIVNSKGTDVTIPKVTILTAGLMEPSQKIKLEAIDPTAQPNVQSDWNEADSTSDAFIQNKPTIDDSIVLSWDTINHGVTARDGSLAVVPLASETEDGLLTVNDYNKLQNLSVLLDGNGDVVIDYNDLNNAPIVNNNNAGQITNVDVNLLWTAGTNNGIVSVTSPATGSSAFITAVTDTKAGLMTPTQKGKLDGITLDADGNVSNIKVDLDVTRAVTSGVITNTKGDNATLLLADNNGDGQAGLMSAAQSQKLNSIDASDIGTKPDWNATPGSDDEILNKPSLVEVLNDLTDVTITTPAIGDTLTYTGSVFVNSPVGTVIYWGGFVELDDTDTEPSPAPTQPTLYLTSNSGTALWPPAEVGNQYSKGDRVFYDPTSQQYIVIANTVATPVQNLSIANRGETTLDVAISGGSDATIPAATSSLSGLMTKAMFEKLNGIDDGAEANIDPTISYSEPSRTLSLTPGTSTAILPLASTTVDGLMSKDQHDKLTLIEEGAQANVNPTQSYTPDIDKGTLTLSPGNDNTIIPIVNNSYAGLATPGMLDIINGLSFDGSGNITNVAPALSYSAATDKGVVKAANGTTDAEIPLAGTVDVGAGTQNNAGLMTAAEKQAIAGLSSISGNTNLSYIPAADKGTVTSDTGTNANLILAGTQVDLGAGLVSMAGLMSPSDKVKLDGVEAAAQKNVQANWNESTNTSDAFILNKPTLGTQYEDLSLGNTPAETSVTVKLNQGTGDSLSPVSTSVINRWALDGTDKKAGVISYDDGVKWDAKLSDALSDTFSYGRKDGAWAKVLPYDFTTLPSL